MARIIAPIGLDVPEVEGPDLSTTVSPGSGASDESVRVGDLDTDKLDDPLTVLSTPPSSAVRLGLSSVTETLGRRTGLKIKGFNFVRRLTRVPVSGTSNLKSGGLLEPAVVSSLEVVGSSILIPVNRLGGLDESPWAVREGCILPTKKRCESG